MNNQNESYGEDAYLVHTDGGPTDMIEDQQEGAYILEQQEGGGHPDSNDHPSVVNEVFDTLVCGMQSAFQNAIAPLAFDYGQVCI